MLVLRPLLKLKKTTLHLCLFVRLASSPTNDFGYGDRVTHFAKGSVVPFVNFSDLYRGLVLSYTFSMAKKITILGSTGSIGTQALEVISVLRNEFEIIALSAGSNIELARTQIKTFNPKKVCLSLEADAAILAKEFGDVEFLYGDEGLLEVASNKENDLVLVAVSGKIGLKPTIAAIENGIDIALANKETLVMAGEIVMKKAKENNVLILPVDSEHSAIYQCIHDYKNIKDVRKLIITASGGPFRNRSIEDIKKATVDETLAHPKWNMGKKITVDSATLMNKGLEIIEAYHLFGINYDNIEVVVHPQSIIHSAVEYHDGSVVAQMGLPSMHIPIQFALSYPRRVEGIKTDSLDFVQIGHLDFETPDTEKFPCLKLAIDAGKAGGLYPVALNAANEEAVFAFLDKKICLYDISIVIERMLNNVKNSLNILDIEDIFEYDMEVRTLTRELIATSFGSGICKSR